MADIRSFFSSATAATQASSNEAETTRQDSTNNNCHDTFNQVAGHPAATQPVAGAMPMHSPMQQHRRSQDCKKGWAQLIIIGS